MGDEPETLERLEAAREWREAIGDPEAFGRRVAQLGQNHPMPPVASSLHRASVDVFGSRKPVTWEVAQCVTPWARADELAGSRGESASGSSSAVYAASSADVVLDQVVDENGSLRLAGQILPLVESPGTFSVVLDGPAMRHIETDDLGQFSLADLPGGAYVLTAHDGRLGVELALELGS